MGGLESKIANVKLQQIIQHAIYGDIRRGIQATGGHSWEEVMRGESVKLIEVISRSESGVITAKIAVKNPVTNEWIIKKTPSSIFPETWSNNDIREAVEYIGNTSEPDLFGKINGNYRGIKIVIDVRTETVYPSPGI